MSWYVVAAALTAALTGNLESATMNAKMESLVDAIVVAEIAFLLHAKINAGSEDTAEAVVNLGVACGELIDYIDGADYDEDDRVVALGEAKKILDALSVRSKHALAELRHYLNIESRMVGKMEDLDHNITVVTVRGITVFCHGKIDSRNLVGVEGQTLDGQRFTGSYIVQNNESWVSVAQKVVPMYKELADVMLSDLYGSDYKEAV